MLHAFPLPRSIVPNSRSVLRTNLYPLPVALVRRSMSVSMATTAQEGVNHHHRGVFYVVAARQLTYASVKQRWQKRRAEKRKAGLRRNPHPV
jgi:hypothetical protein